MRVLRGHANLVLAVATVIVSGSGDNSVRVWYLATGKEVGVFEGHGVWVMAVACAPDGTHVASGSYDCSARVWDLATGKEERVLKGHTDWVISVNCSPDGAHVVSRSEDQSLSECGTCLRAPR